MKTRVTKGDLTDQQLRALRIFRKISKDGRAPSIKEWAKAMERCYSTVDRHKTALTDLGLITSTPGQNRSTRMTQAGKHLLGVK